MPNKVDKRQQSPTLSEEFTNVATFVSHLDTVVAVPSFVVLIGVFYLTCTVVAGQAFILNN